MLMINIIINNTIVIIAAVIAVVTVPILSQQILLTINMFITKIKLIEYKSFDVIMIFIFNISALYIVMIRRNFTFRQCILKLIFI